MFLNARSGERRLRGAVELFVMRKTYKIITETKNEKESDLMPVGSTRGRLPANTII